MRQKFTTEETREVARFWLSLPRAECDPELRDTIADCRKNWGISRDGIEQSIQYLAISFKKEAISLLQFMEKLEEDLDKVVAKK